MRVRVSLFDAGAISRDSNIWEGDKGVRNTLVNEVIRWQTLFTQWRVKATTQSLSIWRWSVKSLIWMKWRVSSFFYMRLVDKFTGAGEGDYGCGQWSMEHSMLVIESYGMDRFIADIEISRQFWRDGEHVISDILDYSAGAGFRDICADSGLM